MAYSSLSFNRFTNTIEDAFIVPRIRQDKPPVLYAHSAAGTAGEAVGHWQGGNPSAKLLIKRVADAGYPIAAGTFTQTWGNATTMSRMNDSLTWLRANTGANNDPPFVIGASHGGACGLTYALNNTVSGVVGIIPVIDLQNARVNDILSSRAVIDAAWGVTYPAALPADSNPYTEDPNCPIQLWISTNDTFSTGYATYATNTGAEVHTMGAIGHSDAGIAAVDVDELIAFLDDNSP